MIVTNGGGDLHAIMTHRAWVHGQLLEEEGSAHHHHLAGAYLATEEGLAPLALDRILQVDRLLPFHAVLDHEDGTEHAPPVHEVLRKPEAAPLRQRLVV